MSKAHTSSNSYGAQMHPLPYLYLVGYALSASLSPLTGADRAVIYAPRHTRCQTCRLWLHTGKFWRCCNVAVRLSSAEAMCCALGLNMESLSVSVGKRRSFLSVRNSIGDATQGHASFCPSFSTYSLSSYFPLSSPLLSCRTHFTLFMFEPASLCRHLKSVGNSFFSFSSYYIYIVFLSFPFLLLIHTLRYEADVALYVCMLDAYT